MKNALGHIGMGLLLMLVFGLLLQAAAHAAGVVVTLQATLWIVWALQGAYWLGRERRDHEIKVQRERFVDLTQWPGALQGWWIFGWSADGRKDFFAPVFGNLLVPLVPVLFG